MLDIWVNTAAILAAIAAIVALCFNWAAIRESTRSRHLQTFQHIFVEIRALEEKFYRDYKGKNTTDSPDIKDWLSLFFNTLEYYAFLVNQKHLEKELSEFYNDAFLNSYDNIFMEHADKYQKENPKEYAEMKKLYKQLKPTISSDQ